MKHTAKLFMNGCSQAVRLPVDCRLGCDEVYIRKDTETGDVINSKRPCSWDNFFELTKNLDIPKDFMVERDNDTFDARDLF